MTGVEETVAGWFASSIIGKVIDVVSSYLHNNYALQSRTTEMLSSLENSLPQIQAAIGMASKMPTKNPELIKWMDKLKNAAYEIKDVLDDFEAKRILESFKGKNKVIESGKFVKSLFLPDKELKRLESAVEMIGKTSMEAMNLIDHLHNEYIINANTLHTNTHRKETSSFLDPNAKIFGRDVEIYFILDMILDYHFKCCSTRYSEPESQPTPPSDGEPKLPDQNEANGTSSFMRLGQGSKGKRKWSPGTSSEVGKKGKEQEISIRNWKLPVLPICGLGGVGKTTVAKMVYNSDIVKECFDQRAWVYVSQLQFGAKLLLKKILDTLRSGGGSTIDTRLDSDNGIPNFLKNMRYFLILDNVHDGIEYNWSYLFSVLSYGAPGSFILVTTQSERVAKSIGNMSNIITLGVLESDWFDILFKYYAFGGLFDFDPKSGRGSISRRNNIAIAELFNLDDATLSTLELIATKIACKLHGLPLAGKVIGKILHTRLERVYWEEILRSDWWNEECALEGILPSLEIGFMDLDPDLKECFKFCSIFPKYYVFDRNTLVQMWMAHNFVKPNKEESFQLDIKEIRLEDVGKKRFDKLVDRSFFQATISEGKYVMHDLIRELAIAVSSKEFYYVKSMNNHLPSSGHHVGIDRDNSNVEVINQNNTTLRSVILFGNWKNSTDESINNIFAKSTSLRLLDLAYIQFKTNAPFDAICQLSHLRFVDLSFSRIKFIPDKFCELCHLQVLNVRGCKFGKLPKDINKLINLRHFYASVETTSLISGIGKLTNLQELEEFRVEKRKGYEISELRDMNEISGHLLLSDLQNISSKDEAATSQLTEKKYLKSLELRFRDHSGVPLEVLEALKPSPSVEEVTIYSRRGEYLPCWISQKENSNLKRVEIRSFWLSTLPAFGELPYLEVLSFHELLDLEKVGDEFYGYSSVVFPSLKELTFSVMPRWTVWSDSPVGKMSFPHLVKIHLKNCERLREMPTNSFPSSMLDLKLDFCQNINNISTVLQGMRCLTHLSISKCRNDRIFDYCTELNMLEFLHLSEIKRLCFVGGLKSLINLRKLEIVGFDEILQSFEVQQENEGPSQQNRFLTSLHLDHSNSSTQRLPVAGRFKYLRFLLIRNSPVTEYTEGEENWFNQLTSLETLEFSNCRHLTRLPSTLPLLTKLKKLSIEVCPMISSLPEFSLPPYLTELYITGCSHELKERCLPHQGDDWWKISHIPNIQIDRENSSYIL